MAANIADRYLKECSAKRSEPYYGFIKSIHEGVIDCDLDFVPADDIRRMSYALTLAGSAPSSAPANGKSVSDTATVTSSISDLQHPIRILSFARGLHRDRQHPPVRSSTTEPYRKLLQTYGERTTNIGHPSPTEGSDVSKTKSGNAQVSAPTATSGISGLGSFTIPHFRKGVALKLVTGIANTIKQYSAALLELHLVNVDLDASCAKKLSDALISAANAGSGSCSPLRVLNLSDNPRLEDAGATAIAAAVPHLQCLAKLELRRCSLTNASTKAIVSIVASNASKAQAGAWKGALRGGGQTGMGGAQGQRTALTHIDLAGNFLGGGSGTQLSSGNYTAGALSGSFISSASSPTFSSPSSASYFDKGSKRKGDPLTSPQSELGYNSSFTGVGAGAGIGEFSRDLLASLKLDDSLSTLILRENLFSIKEIVAFSEHFCSNTALEELDFSDCSGIEHVSDLSALIESENFGAVNGRAGGFVTARRGLLLRISPTEEGIKGRSQPSRGSVPTAQRGGGSGTSIPKRSNSHRRIPTPLSVAAMKGMASTTSPRNPLMEDGNEYYEDGLETFNSDELAQFAHPPQTARQGHHQPSGYPYPYPSAMPYPAAMGYPPYGYPYMPPPAPFYPQQQPPPPPLPPALPPNATQAEKELSQWAQAAYQQLLTMSAAGGSQDFGGTQPLSSFSYPLSSGSQQQQQPPLSGASMVLSPATPANRQQTVSPSAADYAYSIGGKRFGNQTTNIVDNSNGPVGLQELLLGSEVDENEDENTQDKSAQGSTHADEGQANTISESGAAKLNRNFENLLREFMAKMELDDEHKTLEMERLRQEVQSQNETIETLNETVKKNETKQDSNQKENAQKLFQLSKAQANQQILGQQRPAPQFIVKETPRTDQELLMSHLSTEFAMLIGQGIRKIEKQIDPKQDLTGGAATSTSAHLLSNRLPLGTGGALSANTSSAAVAKKATFEDEVANRLTQLGW